MGISDASDAVAVIKTAKKSLERQDSGSMKLKELAKIVVAKLGHDDEDDKKLSSSTASSSPSSSSDRDPGPSLDSIKKCIAGSDKFTVDGKIVSLAGDTKKKKKKNKTKKKKRKRDGRKRKRDENNSRDGADETDTDTDETRIEEKRRKAAEKSEREDGKKTGKNTETAATAVVGDDRREIVRKWRTEHKIVLKSARDDDDDNDEGANADTTRLQSDASFHPRTTFDSCRGEIATPLLEHCTDTHMFLKPTPIQAQCWPVMLRRRITTSQDGDDDGRDDDKQSRGRDVVGIAETGSGKTLAFAMPALTVMYRSGVKDGNENDDGGGGGIGGNDDGGGGGGGIGGTRGRNTTRKNNNGNSNNNNKSSQRLPRMLVLAPTRELAMQSHEVLADFGSVVDVTSLVVYGGVPKHTQSVPLRRKRVDCIVATPGRLRDLLQERVVDLSQIEFLTLDEADRMLDMGFEEDVRFIISKCKSKDGGRQTVMFSATWPSAIQRIALEYMVDPVRVYVGLETLTSGGADGSSDGSYSGAEERNGASGGGAGAGGGVIMDHSSLSANRRVTQTVEVIEDRSRYYRLKQLLKEYHGADRTNRVLVFALYKKEAQRLENDLQRDGWVCQSIHGAKTQDARTKALGDFRSGKCPLLVATDVAARGLDIPNVEVVINYTFPLTIEDYVHRIGRTGRAGKNGRSHTFFQPGDKSHAGELQRVMRQAGQAVPDELMKFGSTIKRKEHKLYGNFGPRDTGMPMKKAVKIKFTNSDDEE